jgi:quinol monooxygenase YgiN
VIVVSGIMKLDPANHDQFAEAGIKMAAASNAEEGVITYGFWASLEERGVFRVFEEYADDAAVASHFATPHMAEFMGVMGSVGITEATVEKYTVSEKGNLM